MPRWAARHARCEGVYDAVDALSPSLRGKPEVAWAGQWQVLGGTMSLLDLWKSNAKNLKEKRIEQLVALAGGGKLTDGGAASSELREFLGTVAVAQLQRYVGECLTDSFVDGGLVLQDLVNELGARLGCAVERGLYRGKTKAIGFDGIWTFPDKYKLLVEVKTTDTYTVPLDRIAKYRSELIKDKRLTDDSSILIVVGRNDTDSLEAQVRGSRHGWDIRLISVDRLIKLVELKESADEKTTIDRIRRVLTPLELTRVDFIVDLLATAADDIANVESEEVEEKEVVIRGQKEKQFTPVAFHEPVMNRVVAALGVPLRRETRSLYVSNDKAQSVRVVASRAHTTSGGFGYWFAFHAYYADSLKEFASNSIAFGCGGPEKILMFDLKNFVAWVPEMNVSKNKAREYHHVHIFEDNAGRFEIRLRGGKTKDVTAQLLK
jgi:hypothetical protein